jgi:hypothetical protein
VLSEPSLTVGRSPRVGMRIVTIVLVVITMLNPIMIPNVLFSLSLFICVAKMFLTLVVKFLQQMDDD